MLRFFLTIIITITLLFPRLALSESALLRHHKTEPTPTAPAPISLVSSIKNRFVQYVHKTVETLRYSVYQLGGSRFDTSRGVYILDCSSYVDHVLQAIFPNAYSSLVNSSGSGTPNTQQYYHFFSKLQVNNPKHHWNKIEDVAQLQPGDILVFRYTNARKVTTGGHVMVVMNTPKRKANAFSVRVADSASTGHSKDTRPPHVSGIGIGTLQLKVNPKTGQPAAFAWKEGACWKRNVHFAMARPIDISS